MPLPQAFQSLFFKNKDQKPYLFRSLLSKDSKESAARDNDESDHDTFSLAHIKAELANLRQSHSSAAQDVTQIHTNLSHLYQISHALEAAIASAQEALLTNENASTSHDVLAGYDCSLDELNEMLTEVAGTISSWLDVLSSGPPEIDAGALHFDMKRDLVGEGAFGKVYKGSIGGSEVAIKIPNYQLEESSSSELEEVRQEIRVLRKIFHPNVVLLLGACTDPGSIRIVFELMKTSVKSLITESKYKFQKNYDTAAKLKVIKDVAKGIAWLHSPSVKIIHRDLKLDNLMIDFSGNGKVCDFGLGVFKKGGETIRDTIKGNLLYRAPELMMHSRGQVREVEFTEKIDVYGFAILVWEIFRGEEWYPPHPYDEPSSYCDFVCDGKRPGLIDDKRVTWPPLLAALVGACWEQEPGARPSMEEVVQAVTGVEYEQWKQRIASKIKSDVGREFWLSNFSEARVSWPALRAAVSRTIKQAKGAQSASGSSSSSAAAAPAVSSDRSPPARFGALRRLLCCSWEVERANQKLSDYVTIESFNVVQAAFGPFYVQEYAKPVLAEMADVVTEAWFHGYVTRQIAEERLKVTHRELGTFLVRLSVSQPNVPFVISYVSASDSGARAIHHLKITRPRWGKSTLVMDGAEYESLRACVEQGKQRNILIDAAPSSIPINPYSESFY